MTSATLFLIMNDYYSVVEMLNKNDNLFWGRSYFLTGERIVSCATAQPCTSMHEPSRQLHAV